MRPRGRMEADRARADGRWGRAYAGAAAVDVPDDLAAALDRDPAAAVLFAGLGSSERYAILHQVITAPNPGVRANRVVRQLELLVRKSAGDS